MIRFRRTMTLRRTADVPKAIGISRELTSYLNSTYKIDLKVGMEVFGGSRFVWEVELADMAAFQSIYSRILQDPKYWEHANRAADLWLDGSMADDLVQLLD